MPQGAIAAGNTAYLAAEYLVRTVGQEAAQKANLPSQVWTQTLTDNDSLTAHFRFLNPLPAPSPVAENTTLPQVTWNPTGVTISAGLSGEAVQYSKVLRSLTPETLAIISQSMSNALARYLDTSIAATFPSLTGGTVGTSGSALTTSMVLAAVAALDSNFADSVGDGVYHGVLHPHVFLDLQNDVMSKNYGIAKLSVDVAGRDVLTIGGATFVKNALVPTLNSAADYAGALFNSQAIGLAIAEAPMVEVIAIPTQHSWSIDGTIDFGVGVIRPTLGVLIQSGKTA